ncbi:MAG: tetratricopeptide repeat protein [Chitinophagales bacterium]|nr:tetratricopeptide repeat protein [Chitinophagales bacterium]
MKYICLTWFCICSGLLSAQTTERGAVVTNTSTTATGKVYALIVGVSKYTEVTPLKFADRDALAFADFLKSKAGGNVPTDNIRVYTNEDANRANIIDELYNLKSTVQSGDLLYFYFAGHGDIEQELSEGEDALLLLSKSLNRNYLKGSEFIELDKLRGYISNFAKKGVNVVFVADACHSGAMLSGGSSGKERTLSALQEAWSNEVKLLSCQPNEVSEESPKWGGGRGVFSYVLEDALKGMADANNDSVVTVGELKRYIENEVARQTGDAQNPHITGDPKRRINVVDMPTLLALKEQKKQTLPEMIAMNAGRSLEDNMLATATPDVKEKYAKFKDALEKGNLLQPKGKSAYDIYTWLSASDASAEVKRITKRNLVSALQDGAMVFIQEQLGGKKDADNYNEKVVREQLAKWQNSIDNLDTAIAILGEEHYLTSSYKARKHYLQASVLYYKITNYTREYTVSNRDSCINHLKLAISLENNASYAHYLLGSLYSFCHRNDSARIEFEKYMKLNPRDGYAFADIAVLESRKGNKDIADSLLAVAIKVGSNQMDEFMNHIASYYYVRDEYEQAKKYFFKALEYNPDFSSAHLNLGVLFKIQKDYDKALYHYGKVLKYDSAYAWAYNNMANIYLIQKKYDIAKEYFGMAIKFDSTYHTAYTNLGILYEDRNDYNTAFRLYHLSKSIEPYYENNYYGIGNVHYNQQRYDSAELYYYYCIQLDSNYYSATNQLANTYRKTNETDLAEYYYKKAALIDTTKAGPYVGLGHLKFDAKLYNEAATYYSWALLKDTTDADYWYNLGRAWQYADSTDLAIKVYRKKVLKIDSAYSAAYNNIGIINYRKGIYDTALCYYRSALKFDTCYTSSLYNCALIYEKKNEIDSTLYYYKKCIQCDSTYSSAYSALATFYNDSYRPDSAIKYYALYIKHAMEYDYDATYSLAYLYLTKDDSLNVFKYCSLILQNDSANVAARYLMASACQNKGNYNAARKYYKQIESDEGFGKYVLYQYGAIAETIEQYDSALYYYKLALALDSLNPDYLNRVGQTLGYRLKKYDEAFTYHAAALDYDSFNQKYTYSYIAYNYFLKGDMSQAIEWYKKAIELTPLQDMAYYNLACIYSLQKNDKDALLFLAGALKNGYRDFEHMKKDTDLDHIRSLPDYKKLLQQYAK